MQAPSNALRADSTRRLVVKLVIATVSVAVTAAIAFDDRPAPVAAAAAPSTGAAPLAALASEARHAPLSETASTSVSDLPDATAPVADRTSASATP